VIWRTYIFPAGQNEAVIHGRQIPAMHSERDDGLDVSSCISPAAVG